MERATDAILSIINDLRVSKEPESPALFGKLILKELQFLSAAEGSRATGAIRQLLLQQGSVPASPLLFPIISALLDGHHGRVICDPWAGIGTLLALAQEATKADEAIAIVPNDDDFQLGRALMGSARWELGDPLDVLQTLPGEFDAVVSIPPIGLKSERTLRIKGATGEMLDIRDSMGNLVLTSASAKLSQAGLSIFVVPLSFISSQNSVFHRLSEIGLGVEAVFALPSGALGSNTDIQSYLVVIRRGSITRMFVGKFSNDTQSNLQIVSNFKNRKTDGPPEFGRYVDPRRFAGFSAMRLAERIEEAKRTYGAPAVTLDDLSARITLGRAAEDFHFPSSDNAIYVPLIGTGDVVSSLDELAIKPQNYAQVDVDPSRASARFVLKFLNSELGKEIRQQSKTGSFILKLNLQTLKSLIVFTPDMETQRRLLQIETAITAERNTVMSLQNELMQCERELWKTPQSAPTVFHRIKKLSDRLAGGLTEHASSDRIQWIEMLPFPLASILRAWEATPMQDCKTKYEHLLHFFEATAEFLSIILLSAYTSNETLFSSHREALADALHRQHLSFERSTFGLWKAVLEYFGKRTRTLATEERSLCTELFCDSTVEFPTIICDKRVAQILSRTNQMRNDWSGHGGVVGQGEAQLRNEQLVGEFEQLRGVFGDVWKRSQVIRGLQSRFRNGAFENDVKVLVGSNPGFLTESRVLVMAMDVDRMYLMNKGERQALKLIPLLQMGPSPLSDNNACYFFNRIDRSGVRFISYHYADRPELTGTFAEASEIIQFLTSVSADGSSIRRLDRANPT